MRRMNVRACLVIVFRPMPGTRDAINLASIAWDLRILAPCHTVARHSLLAAPA